MNGILGKGYKPPKTFHPLKIKQGIISKTKNDTYLDTLMKEKKKIPDSVKYSKIKNWNRNW